MWYYGRIIESRDCPAARPGEDVWIDLALFLDPEQIIIAKAFGGEIVFVIEDRIALASEAL